MTEDINLGEFITLKGFADEEGSTMVVVKKMVGSYVKKIMEDIESFQDATITLKRIHGHEKEGKVVGGKSEVHVKLSAGKVSAAEFTDFNIFVALDKAFKKAIAAA
jgi:ribosome-associated translation inhibitor RaiA